MDAFTVMGAAATVSKQDDDLTSSQKTASSKSQDRRKTTASMVVCSSCKTQLGIFKRKVGSIILLISTNCLFLILYKIIILHSLS